jgi:hypothetical protein
VSLRAKSHVSLRASQSALPARTVVDHSSSSIWASFLVLIQSASIVSASVQRDDQ